MTFVTLFINERNVKRENMAILNQKASDRVELLRKNRGTILKKDARLVFLRPQPFAPQTDAAGVDQTQLLEIEPQSLNDWSLRKNRVLVHATFEAQNEFIAFVLRCDVQPAAA